jgi:D-alanyl-D-alanine carboxypeptidase (penicillin-binding protein 5/6)
MKKLLIPLLITNFIYAQSFVPDAPELDLKSYILIEPNTNTVIAEFNSDSEIEPASMTKIMTSYVVADQIANDLIFLDDQVLN